jgi:hypothetical protein
MNSVELSLFTKRLDSRFRGNDRGRERRAVGVVGADRESAAGAGAALVAVERIELRREVDQDQGVAMEALRLRGRESIGEQARERVVRPGWESAQRFK